MVYYRQQELVQGGCTIDIRNSTGDDILETTGTIRRGGGDILKTTGTSTVPLDGVEPSPGMP